MRMWRNWQTRRFQVPVGDRAGSNPVIRTSKSTNFDKRFVDFFLSIQIAYTKQKRWQWSIDKEKMYAIIRSRLQAK